jgi:hypothetical protein
LPQGHACATIAARIFDGSGHHDGAVWNGRLGVGGDRRRAADDGRTASRRRRCAWKPGPGLDELRGVNPLAQVPTLVTPDDGVLSESAAILIHLGERFPASGLLPEEPKRGRNRCAASSTSPPTATR